MRGTPAGGPRPLGAAHGSGMHGALTSRGIALSLKARKEDYKARPDRASKETVMRLLLRIIGVLALVTGLGLMACGCNTVHGAGEDIEATGEAIQDSSD